jgi:archaetidylinositol phosphate synthase
VAFVTILVHIRSTPAKGAAVSPSVTKIDHSPLTPVAQRIAARIIPQLPRWVMPNHVTVSGYVCNLVGCAAFYLASFNGTWFLLGILALVGNWIADNLDGELARARRLTSERGFYLDLVTDQLGVATVCLGIAFASYTNTVLMLFCLLSYPILSFLTLMHIVMRQRFPLGRFSPAEGRLGLIVLALLTWIYPGPLLTLFDTPLGWFDLLIPLSLIPAIWEKTADAIALYRELAPPQPMQ